MAELTGINPPVMDWGSSDLPTAFKNFKDYSKLILDGPLKDKSDSDKVTYVLLWLGQEGLRIHGTWTLTEQQKNDLDHILDSFEKHFEPKSNYRICRFNLQKYRQGEESVDQFMTKCKIQANKCKFRDPQEFDERLIEQLIVGTKHTKVQERLLSKEEMTLDQAMNTARTFEATLTQMDELNAEVNVDGIRPRPRQHNRNRPCGRCGFTYHKNGCT